MQRGKGSLSKAVEDYCLSPVPSDLHTLREELIALGQLIDRLKRLEQVVAYGVASVRQGLPPAGRDRPVRAQPPGHANVRVEPEA